MKVTKTHIDILKKARKDIEYKSQTYICKAINEYYNYKTSYECEELKDWISRQLNGYLSYEGWLYGNASYHIINQMHTPEGTKLRKEARLAWIDNMISVLENELKGRN